jgi:hypothetical protein
MIIAFIAIITENLIKSLAAINIFSVLFPIFVIIHDRQLPRIKGRKEYLILKLIKFFYILIYWCQMIILYLIYISEPLITEAQNFEEEKIFLLKEKNGIHLKAKNREISEITQLFLFIVNLNVLIYPFLACIYSKLIFYNLSKPMTR